MGELTAADFPAFFEGVYGYRPFPWQTRLAAQVVETGRWPELLDLPTGTGKTAALDVALFALAVRRDMPRRIVFVVDRRIVVHQAAQRVASLVERLDEGADGVIGEVARRLRALAPSPRGTADGPVVRWSELRGGIVRDEGWATRPDVPAVLVSTVDQVGSRLLFRGYGVTSSMRPVHAGLLGSDSLFLLDEVHLARPFRKTLRAIRSPHYRGGDGTSGLPDRWTIVELSATPAGAVEDRFTLVPADRSPVDQRDVGAAATLSQRLAAHKRARLREVKTGAKPATHGEAIAKACVTEVAVLLDAGVQTVGVIVNRVATAARVHRELGSRGDDAILVTGRMRPIDRDEVVRRLERRAGTDRDRSEDQAPVVVVATQAVEAGADLDLDALVTECASLDSLRQRFGRVDRLGALSASGASPTSVILGGSSAVAAGADDAVYGTALAQTWAWLSSVADEGIVDFGSDYLPSHDARRAKVLPPQPWCPQLLPSHLDRWVQTSTVPHADPTVAHWLHGLEERPADVSVIWRADVTSELLASSTTQHEADGGAGGNGARSPRPRAEILDDLLETCPPDAREALELPATAVRQWLVARAEGRVPEIGASVADAPMAIDVDPGPRGRPELIAPVVLIGTGGMPGSSTVTDQPRAIAPGVTIVVPCTFGGVAAGSWDPSSTSPVADRASAARALADRRAVVRIVEGGLSLVAAGGHSGGNAPDIPALEQFGEDVDDATVEASDTAAASAWLDSYRAHAGEDDAGPEIVVAHHLLRHRLKVRRQQLDYRLASGQPRQYLVVTSGRRIPARELSGVGGESTGAPVDSEPATSSFLGREVGLREHLDDVRAWATCMARNIGLPEPLVDDLALAGWLHDLGKADLRFQTMLHTDGLGHSGELLAKSALGPGDRRGRRRARAVSGYPPGMRHELLSVALVEHHDGVMARANDRDLVLHLVASHHGYCRPFAPVVIDPSPMNVSMIHDGFTLDAGSAHELARLDSGVSERFWQLVGRYGWWELAWLEAVLRLADHRASEAAEQAPERLEPDQEAAS